jgi:chromosome segregation protein
VHFTRLRLSGFKSFVDPTEFRIEPGLTGVVGPNGCGKSNLLEALRWVMGASSAKAMRGEGMDDVIFSGSSARPGRNHAEVILTVDNPGGAAGARFAAEPVLEVARRIDRGAGSSYRINGVEARARDVQLLFADASTGANSPALVRQGQVSELIAAKPQNRRRILEEAAGVSGLHGRRHEAQLRVRAAEANLVRLEDLSRQLESGLGRLRREARTAARYRRLSAEIRDLQAAALHARWSEADASERVARAEAAQARTAAEAAGREAARASTAALQGQADLPALRDEDLAAAAILGRLAIEKDRLDQALESARADLARLSGEVARIAADTEREARLAEDARAALRRVEGDLARTEAEIASAPERVPALEADARSAEAARVDADAALEAAAVQLAAAQAEARGAQTALEAAQVRADRLSAAVAQARRERRALDPLTDPALPPARADLAAAILALDTARADVEAAESGRAAASRAEAEARRAARAAEDALARSVAELRGLARLAAPQDRGGFSPVLEQIGVAPGLEAALAAALGDDLEASLDPRAPRFWRGGPVAAPAWSEGVTPLAPHLAAPSELAARLAHVGLVAREDGPSLQGALAPGARLVSRQGDLWRWDGFTAIAGAPRPAQVRLEQKTRLAALEAEVAGLRPIAAETLVIQTRAAAALSAAESAAAAARERPRAADRALARARETVERLEREAERKEIRAGALDETRLRLETDQAEAQAALDAARAAFAAIPPVLAQSARLVSLRANAARAREAAFAARTALEREVAARGARLRRQETLLRDQADWRRRTEAAAGRGTSLEAGREAALAALDKARAAPDGIGARRDRLLNELSTAQTRKARAADALAVAEAARAQADRAARAADARAADTREARASAEARLEAAEARTAEQALAVREATGLDPEALGRRIADSAVATPAGVAGIEAHLAALERDRDALGAVNLLAEDEAAEVTARLAAMAAERVDLAGALNRLRQAIEELNAEGRERLTAAFAIIDGHFRDLFTTLFQGGAAELRLVESEDPLEAGLEILACPPGKRLTTMSLMSGGEQALTAAALIFAVFLANPAPICVLDEVDAPLDDANVARFCDLLAEMRRRAPTRFLTITHNPLTMSRMDRLFGVTMRERGVSQLVSVDLRQAEALAAR